MGSPWVILGWLAVVLVVIALIAVPILLIQTNRWRKRELAKMEVRRAELEAASKDRYSRWPRP